MRYRVPPELWKLLFIMYTLQKSYSENYLDLNTEHLFI